MLQLVHRCIYYDSNTDFVSCCVTSLNSNTSALSPVPGWLQLRHAGDECAADPPQSQKCPQDC